MIKVGLTGGIASGKSTVAKFLSEVPDFDVYPTDDIAKVLMLDMSEAVIKVCGEGVRGENSQLDWGKLGELLFANNGLRKQVEGLVHEPVWEYIQSESAKVPLQIPVVESAIIYQIGWQDRFDVMVVAHCSQEEQQRRCREVRGMSDDEIERRMGVQAELGTSDMVLMSDFAISTECSMETLQSRVDDLVDFLRTKERNAA